MRWFLLILPLFLSVACDRGAGSSASTRQANERFVRTMNEGHGLMGRFEFAAARNAFDKALALKPDSIDAMLDVAIARLNEVDPNAQEEAIERFARVLAVDPDQLGAHYCTGLAHLYLGRPLDARPHFELVARERPYDAHVAYFLAQALEQGGDPDAALESYRRAEQLDPFLRSSALGIQRTLSRMGDESGAADALKRFEDMAGNPRSRLAEFKYSRMGDLAMVTLPVRRGARLRASQDSDSVDPATDVLRAFEKMELVLDRKSSGEGSIQVVDLDGDGSPEVVLAGYGEGRTSLVGRREGDELVWQEDHALGGISGVHCMLFGDVDGDGMVDAFLCRDGSNLLMMQGEAGDWAALPGLPEFAAVTVDGALADLDHDGDLDVYCVNDGASNRLLNNDGDGSFTDITERAEVGGGDAASRQVVVADLDLDRDADLLVINRDAPNQVYLNDRFWRYARSTDFEALEAEPIVSAIGWYSTFDGEAALRVRTEEGQVSTWSRGVDGQWSSGDQILLSNHLDDEASTLGLANVTGDAKWELLVARSYGVELRNERNQMILTFAQPIGDIIDVSTHLVDSERGPGLLLLTTRGLFEMKASEDRGRFATVRFSGRLDDAQQMRSNASGIGTRWSARVGSTWQAGSTWRTGSGPGQGLQPVAIGMGRAGAIDFIDIEWPDGVYQSELGIRPGGPKLIAETQRQISSCPLVFVRGADDEEFEFLTDVLGVGGMGYLLEPGVAATPRPVESLLLPGRPEEIRLAEPMEEACYLDGVRLVAVDLPRGVEPVLDERLGVAGVPPTSEVIPIEAVRQPVAARNERGEDVLEPLLDHDLVAPDPGPLDGRFIGRLLGEHVLEMEFDAPIDDCDLLLAEGWVEYPYSQTSFAAWQCGATYDAATLEARTAEGDWRPVAERFGYPAGMPRAMCLPIADLPAGCTALRLRSNQEIYWDRLRLARRAPVKVERTTVAVVRAEAAPCGFPERTTGAQRQPHYDYQRRHPFGDVRHQPGQYTAFGDCLPLLKDVDDACAIIGPGEEIRLRFEDSDGPAAGMQRHWVLELNGWCKDMDLFTLEGERLEPLPSRHGDGPDDAARALMARFNLRFASGR